MSEDYYEEIEDLMEMAWDPTSPHSVALLEEAIRIADEHRDIDLGLETRGQFVEAAVMCGHPEKALVAFTWMIGQYDKDPELEERDAEELMSSYFYIVQNVPQFPEISRQQIEEIFDDMLRRTRKHGDAVMYVEMARLVGAVVMGEQEEAEKATERWIDRWEEDPFRCQICCTDCHALSLNFQGKHEKALEVLAPLLAEGPECECPIPMFPYSRALHPLMKFGRWKEAAKYHKKSYRMVKESHGFLNCAAFHIEYLSIVGNLKRGIELFEIQFPLCFQTHKYWYNYLFYLSARVLMQRMKQEGRDQARLRLPEEFPLFEESGQYDVAKLGEWFYQEAEQLAKRFDARNGNSYHTDRLATNETLLETLRPAK